MTKNNDLKMPIDTQLTTLFCLIDDFCTDISEQVEQYMLTCGKINRVFADSATRGKTSVGWFYGFKIHLICDHIGRLISYCITTGNVDDRKVLPDLIEHSQLTGKLFGDRGYVGKNWRSRLAEVGVQLITRVKRNMKPQSLDAFDSAVLRKRGIIEAPFHLMKSQFDLEHTRHRSKIGLLTTIFAALTLYALMFVNGYRSGIEQILKPIELKSA